jgi:hypothetical protein
MEMVVVGKQWPLQFVGEIKKSSLWFAKTFVSGLGSDYERCGHRWPKGAMRVLNEITGEDLGHSALK